MMTGPPRDRALLGRERLAFSYGSVETVPGRGLVEAALARATAPTFSTVPYAEPRDWGYLGLLAFTTVLLFRPQDQMPGLNSLHIAEVCALVGLAPMLLHRFARRLPVFRVTPETIGLALFGAVIIATVPFSIWPGGALQEFIDEYLKVLVVFVLMMNTLTTPKRLDQITWLIVLCIGYVAFRGVFDYARGVNLMEGNRLTGAVNGIFGNPNDLALTMVTFLPVAAVVMISRTHSAVRRLSAAAIMAAMLATIVFTKSRGGMLGLAAMAIALVLLGGKVRRGFGVIVIATLVLASPFAPASFWSRMSSIVDEPQDNREFTGSREARRIVMQEGIDTFKEYPLTGVGAGQFKNYNPNGRRERWRETHNALIQVAAETGFFGLIAFSFLIIRAGMAAAATRRMLARARRDSGGALRAVLSANDRESLYAHTVAMSAGLVGWFVCAQFASVAYSWTFYYLLALTVAARELTRDRLAAARLIADSSTRAMAVPPARTPRTYGPGGRGPRSGPGESGPRTGPGERAPRSAPGERGPRSDWT
ncbi:MAG TPA: O-antigen ligase family protein [Vicinamibacterales bacterium]|nr:O-antigen ligase family protein [Vicinamibacterales bacterium]